jgi:undecaprenyl-diphosphatase
MDALDHRILLALYGGAGGTWGPAMVVLTGLGAGWVGVLLLPLSLWSRTRSWGVPLAVAVTMQAGAVWCLKRVVGRVRPWIELGLPPPIGTPSDHSFPSGHAAAAFCVAVFAFVVLTRKPDGGLAPPRRVRAAAFAGVLLASLVALSRVYLGAHFPGDVVAGAALGSAFGGVAGGLAARPGLRLRDTR